MPVLPSQQSPRIDSIDCDLLREHDVLLRVLRLDLMHPTLHGNKWFKLKHTIDRIQEQGIATVLSFGGAYSNHLYALAAAGKLFGFRTIGIVRGELVEPLNPVLQFAREQGMELVPCTRSEYRRQREPGFEAALRQRFGDFYLLPEGGSNALAVTGCAELAELLQWRSAARPRVVGLACGTGATLAGLISGLSRAPREPVPTVLGTAVLRAPGYLAGAVRDLLEHDGVCPWSVLEQYHCGGYAKSTPALRAFLADFPRYSAVPLEPVYSGKLLFSLFDQIATGAIARGSEVLALHCGGIHQ